MTQTIGAFYASLMFFGAPSAPYGYVICGVDFMYRSVDVIGGVDFVCTVWLMLFVGCILCIVNFYWCAERTLRVCSWCGGFSCTVRSMLS
jgi:hypothetical protein